MPFPPKDFHDAYRYAQKYNFAFKQGSFIVGKGIYAIYCDDALIYIGQSVNMSDRIYTHMRHIINNETREDKELKYEAIRLLRDKGCQISFGALCFVENEEDLDLVEKSYIREYKPFFNTTGKWS